MQTLNITIENNYAIVQLARGKANVINQLMVDEIREAFRQLEADDNVQGVILTGHTGFFSAGLDIKELYTYDKDQIKAFLADFGMMHIEMLRFTKPFVCAINGHCPAGGTVMAIAADYRVMAEGEQYTIGLNEMQVNIQITDLLIRGYSFWLGEGRANEYILEGKLISPSEALSSGLVNAVVHEDKLLSHAENKLKQYLSADPDIFRNTKAKVRKNWLSAIDENDRSELEELLKIWWKPEIRQKMGMFVAMLNARSKSKA